MLPRHAYCAYVIPHTLFLFSFLLFCFSLFSPFCWVELVIMVMRQNWCMVPDSACTCTHSGSWPAPLITAYTMVAPLMARQFCQIQRFGGKHQGAPPTVPPMVLAAPISTPLLVDAWAAALQSHPTREWVECLITGMNEGGFPHRPSEGTQLPVISRQYSIHDGEGRCHLQFSQPSVQSWPCVGTSPTGELCRGYNQPHGSNP